MRRFKAVPSAMGAALLLAVPSAARAQRIDAVVSQFGDRVLGTVPPSGEPPLPHVNSVGVAGLTPNGLLSIDPRGVFYLVGGSGVYNAYVGQGSDAGVPLGISGGAGIAVPVGRGNRVFIEASYHTFSASTQPSWILPITIGLRFR